MSRKQKHHHHHHLPHGETLNQTLGELEHTEQQELHVLREMEAPANAPPAGVAAIKQTGDSEIP